MTRRLAALTLAIALPCARSTAQPAPQPAAPPLTRETRAAVIDSVRRTVVALYVFPDSALDMAAAVAGRARAGAYDTIRQPAALARALMQDLDRAHRDAHLRITYDPPEAARAQAAAAGDSAHRESRDNTARDRAANFFFQAARILPGNIGYVQFTQFPDTSADARRTVRAAMQFVAHTDDLIIDLRDNRGGSTAMAAEIAGYFVRDSAHWSDSYDRLTDRWTAQWIRNRPEITDGTWLGMPLTILTSGWTFSAAEGLAYGLEHGRQARIVGEPTAGGAHVMRRVALGSGFVAFIPYIRSANVVTHTDWEGTGVTPAVRADAGDALLRAQEAILGDRLRRLAADSARDSAAVRRAEWALDEARLAANSTPVAPSELAPYAGRFEEYVFSVRDGALYGRNTSRGNKVDRLRPITATRFALDVETHVEFLRDASGAVRAVRLLWNDGWIDRVARTKE